MGRILPAVCALLLLLGGCSPRPSGAVKLTAPPPAFKAPGNDPWKLVWTDRDSASPALLWNGQMGLRVGPMGNGFDREGNALPMFAITRYDQTGEERIQRLTTPLGTVLRVGGKDLGKVGVEDWKQELDFRTGVLTTSWQEANDVAGNVSVQSELVLPFAGNTIGEKWSVRVEKTAPVEVLANVGSKVLQRSASGAQLSYGSPPVWVAVDQMVSGQGPEFAPPDPVVAIAEAGTRLYGVEAERWRSLVFERTFTVDLSPIHNRISNEPGPGIEFELLRGLLAEKLKTRWKTDIEIDGPIEDQQAVRSFLFYLRSAISPAGKMSISPMGLSSELYGGHVFWDADMWVMPALAFIQPDEAKAIADYRIGKMDAAADNFRGWWLAGGPTAKPDYKAVTSTVLAGEIFGYKFPWESSVTGKETAPGPSRFEDHISGTVAFSLSTAAALGLADPVKASLATRGVSNFYRDRSTENIEKGREIKAVMSPDENHIGDNDLYTNLLAQWCANGGSWNPDMTRSIGFDYTRPPIEYKLPKDEISFLSYDNDPIKSYKQAAAVLAIYPLQYPPAEAQAKVMMDRFADKVIKNGPAMTDSVHSIIWSRIGETDKAYEAWRKGWMEFVRPPFLLFSEKRGQDRTYFATGAAGELNSVIYGFLGFRIDSKPEAGADWSIKLRGDRFLSVKPRLPSSWKRVTFRNFHVLGKTYTLTATHQSVQVTQGD